MKPTCCGSSPIRGTREGGDHTGLDVFVRCQKCGHEVYVEAVKPSRADDAALIAAWTASQRKKA